MKKKRMKAAVMLKKGDPTSSEVLRVMNDVPIPSIKKGEILLKVAASAINPVDWKMVDGSFPLQKKGLVGIDVSGTIEEIGEGTKTDFKVGDKVYGDAGERRPGSFAEYMKILASNVAVVPKNLNMIQCASLPCVGLTAIQALKKTGGIKKGHKVCIVGGSGGVGSIAVQLAKAMEASETWAVGSSVEFIKDLGADKVINYKEESVLDALKDQQFDIIFDTAGSLDSWRAAKDGGLKKGGRFLAAIGDGDRGIPGLLGNWAWRYLKYTLGLGPHYTFFRINTSPPDIVEDMKKLTELLEANKIKPVLVPQSFELTTESLHSMMKASMSHRTKGKLVMTISS
jgi:NADPH:quinone reductase-like Zn-dependent oxidoreductase